MTLTQATWPRLRSNQYEWSRTVMKELAVFKWEEMRTIPASETSKYCDRSKGSHFDIHPHRYISTTVSENPAYLDNSSQQSSFNGLGVRRSAQ